MIVAIVIAIVVACLLAFAATRPDSFRVQRSVQANAPAARIFSFIDDFHQWPQWSPYEKLDPAMKKTFSGPPNGSGAVYNWAGNNKAGEGRMEIVSTVPQSKVVIKLDFVKPFEGHNTAEFTMELKGSSTQITWAMYGPQKFVFKLMSIFVSMDKMIGKSFEEGLAALKTVSENAN